MLARSERRTPAERALGCLLGAAAAEFAVLAVTGVYLVFFYEPRAASSWGAIGHLRTAVTFGDLVRIVHRLTAVVMVLTVVAIAAIALTMAVARSRRTGRPAVTAVAAVAVAIVGLLASFTGYLLPWDQLALRAVTVGTDMQGFRPIIGLSSQVQYVLIGGAVVSVGTIRFWFVVHVVLVPVVILVIGALVGRRLHLWPRRDVPGGHTGLGS